MNSAVETESALSIARIDRNASIFRVDGPEMIVIRAGTRWAAGNQGGVFDADQAITLAHPQPGTDYRVWVGAGEPVALPFDDEPGAGFSLGGFHFSPGGNAPARAGGDAIPAINPYSCWDAGFRPACQDPRGMALVDHDGLSFWCDIYMLGTAHEADGTSRHGADIADGYSLAGGFNFAAAKAAYAHHGKQLLTYDEFRAAAFGVTEKTAAGRDPKVTGLDAARTSRFGIMQATGSMWQWGTDGDPEEPRASIFGGSWLDGSYAGSRCAPLGDWPEDSHVDVSARGRSDHLTLA